MNRFISATLFATLVLTTVCPAQVDPNEKLQELRARMRGGASLSGAGLSADRFMLPSSGLELGGEAGSLGGSSAILDKTIDPATYVMGPGDRLAVYIWGTTEKNLDLVVGSEGVVVVPLLGEVDVRGMTLAQAKQRLTDELMRIYKNVKISITLSSLRIFKTFITGDIETPGAYVVDGATRVSDLVELAGGTKSKQQRRGVQILQDSTIAGYADLALFANTGDMAGNPYIGEGQRVHIPARTAYVAIFGEVNTGGHYDFVDGDRLRTMVNAAGGFSRDADSANIVVSRFTDNGDGIQSSTLSWPADADYPLQQDDRILVCRVPDYRVHRNVSIEGEVELPGVYPIQKDKTRLADVIRMAGGLTDAASPAGSFIIRSRFNRKSSTKTDPNQVVRSLDAIKLDPAGIPPTELSYIKAEYLETEGRMSINFAKALSTDSDPNNIVLREGDHIFVARKELTVRVMGAVRSPGQVSVDGGRGAEYYINQAGGFNRNARHSSVLIRKVGADTWVRAGGQSIDPGDVILVPERKYRDGLVFTRDALSIGASVATILFIFVSVTTMVR